MLEAFAPSGGFFYELNLSGLHPKSNLLSENSF
ncbi:hypothetical protein ABID42_003300 [Arcicella rosea]